MYNNSYSYITFIAAYINIHTLKQSEIVMPSKEPCTALTYT